MSSIVMLGVMLMMALTLYALLGGADYGGGVWDLLATGPTADRQRATIARAIGPVWEANHVWLILVVVVLFTAFPRAFSIVSTYLHIPLVIVLAGIVMRGSAFVFRAYGPEDQRMQRFWGRTFAVASVVTPLFLGVIIGAITDGLLPDGTAQSFGATFVRPWLTPFSIAVGVFALVLFAFLAAVYLTLEAQDDQVRSAFRARAMLAGAGVFVLAATVLFVAAPHVRLSLLASPWAMPLHFVTAASALFAFYCLWRERYQLARAAAAAQVVFILWGWALAQYPFAVRPNLTLAGAAAPANVLALVIRVVVIGAAVMLPSLLYLFSVFGPRGTPLRRHRD